MSKYLKNFFNDLYPSFLVKNLYEDDQNKNGKIVKTINESLINLRNSINGKEIPKNENRKKLSILLTKSLTLVSNKNVKVSKYYLPNKCSKDYQ